MLYFLDARKIKSEEAPLTGVTFSKRYIHIAALNSLKNHLWQKVH